MRISSESITNLNTLLETCSIASIDNLIIEDGKARGVNEGKTVVIISAQNLPDFGDCKVGFNRLGVLQSRVKLVRDNVTIDVKEGNNKEIAQFDIAGSGMKVQYRCASPATIKAPKAINDTISWEFELTAESIGLVLSGAKTMQSKKVVLVTRDGVVSMECTDTNSDIFTATVAETVKWTRSDSDAPKHGFVHSYLCDELLPLLKAAVIAGSATVRIGESGTLHLDINGHRITAIPQMGD